MNIKRSSGILMHITSLPGKYSVGSIGQSAYNFIDFLSDCGFKYWQTLPICMTDECNSPYKSYSAFAGNPYIIDLDLLMQDGLLTEAELSQTVQNTPYTCEYERINAERMSLLVKASNRAHENAGLCEEIKGFAIQNDEINYFCKFMAIRQNNDNKPWFEWQHQEYDKKDLFLWQFIQYEFFRQWDKLKKYANKKGIGIIGDIPIYVSYDSCDVMKNPEQFELDKKMTPVNVAGCPPDYFSPDGQLWGNPLYNWRYMKKDNYTWWKKRMEHMLSLFDGVRIDHFRAFSSYWSIPARAKTAADGKWIKGPGKEFIRALKSVTNDSLIIAEDLGDIDDGVRDLVKYSEFLSMRVFQFAFLGDMESPHLPHNYIQNSAAYTGTHDNNTLLGYIWELDNKTRKKVLSYCGYDADKWDCEQAYDSVIRTLLASHASLVMFPLQDILRYGADTRMNIPGNPDGNWRIRFTEEQINSIDRDKFKYFNSLYGR